MTREGVKRLIAGDPEAERITSKHNDFIIDKVFDYFESPKTCEGCRFNRFGCDSSGYATDCTLQFSVCSRSCNDRYEPKEF